MDQTITISKQELSSLEKRLKKLESINEQLKHLQSEREKAEEALRHEMAFTHALLDSISDGVVACDKDGKLALFNGAARDWHVIDAMKLPQEEWAAYYNLFRADGITLLPTEEDPLARAFKGENVRNATMVIGAVGKPIRHILSNGCPIYNEKNEKIGAVVVMRDVTERKQAEKVLRESEEGFRRIFDKSPIGMAVASMDGCFIRVNDAMYRILGYAKNELLGLTFTYQ